MARPESEALMTITAPRKSFGWGRRVSSLPTGGIRAISLGSIMRHPRALLGLIMTILVIGFAIVGAFWTPYDPLGFGSGDPFTPPSWAYPMGTDIYGRDILSRAMAGAGVSLTVSVRAVAGALVVGTVLGVIAGFFGGIADVILTRAIDILLAIPGLVMALGIVTLLGPSAESVSVALIAVYSWQFARIVRSSVVSARGRSYVEAARGIGASPLGVITRDIFPNVLPVLLVQTTTAFAWGILDEASIGFLGLGVQPPNPSWGSLLIEGRQFMYDAPWLGVGAGAVVVIAVLGVNLLGDGLRDIVDPRSGGVNS